MPHTRSGRALLWTGFSGSFAPAEWDAFLGGAKPRGVRHTAYAGEAAHRVGVPIGWVYAFDEIATAHADMQRGTTAGKLVVTTR